MPTYEYECTKCGHEFEEFQSITADPLSKCPKCKGKVKRLIGAGASIIFKGSGFYATDYRSKEYHEQAKREKTSSQTEKAASKSQSPAKKTDTAKSKD